MHIYRVRVYFEDTDCGGIVYHTNYIKYCERARSEIFFSAKSLPIVESSGFVLTNLAAKFITTASLGDMLEVRSEVSMIKNASITLEQDIYKIFSAKENNACETLVFSAQVNLAFLDVAKSKVTKIPDSMREILAPLLTQ